jgi:uncharacterized iron-regulated membrane protein
MSRVLPTLRLVHAWAGLILSLLLFTMAVSGSLLVFRTEILRAVTPGADQVVATDPAAFARAAAAAEAAFPGRVNGVTFASPAFGLHQVNLKGGGGAYLDPNTGAVLQRWGRNERFLDWVFDFHHHLLSGEPGTRTVGVIGFSGLVLSLVGIVIWVPARRSFKGRVLPASFKRPHLLAAHRDLGILAAPLLIVAMATGASMALPDQSRPLFAALFGGEVEARPGPPMGMMMKSSGSPEGAAPPADWTPALAAAKARFPDADLRSAQWPKKPGGPVQVRLHRAGEWNTNGRTSVTVTPEGRVLKAVDAQGLGRGMRAFNALWPIHASKVGGPLWKVLSLLTGLSLATLALFGAVSFAPRAVGVERRRA